MDFKRSLYICLGFFFVGLAVLGAFLPVLPTTPFLLLACYFFSQSSEKFYKWLTENRFFGQYISDYRQGLGVTVRNKIFTITLLWAVILFSAYKMREQHIAIIIFLFVVAVAVTVHLLMMKTKR